MAAGSEPEDKDWFDALYRTHWDGMVRLAFTMVDDRQVAEDLVQDAFGRMFRVRSDIREPLTYLRSAIYNGCRNHLRGLARRRQWPSPRATDTSGPVGDHVIDVVRRLPPRQRCLVVLRYDAGLTDPEIARTTGLPLGTVKSTLHRSLAALRKELT